MMSSIGLLGISRPFARSSRTSTSQERARDTRRGSLSSNFARAKFEESDPRLVSRALSCDVLVLDDLANGRDIPSSPIEDIIAERHKNGSATWVTTYRDYKALAGLMGGDIARRVYERAFIIDCNPRKGAEACPDS